MFKSHRPASLLASTAMAALLAAVSIAGGPARSALAAPAAATAQEGGSPSVPVSTATFTIIALWQNKSGDEIALADYLNARGPEPLDQWVGAQVDALGELGVADDANAMYPALFSETATDESQQRGALARILIQRTHRREGAGLTAFVSARYPETYRSFLAGLTPTPANVSLTAFTRAFFPQFEREVDGFVTGIGGGPAGGGDERACECRFNLTQDSNPASDETTQYSGVNDNKHKARGSWLENRAAHGGHFYLYRRGDEKKLEAGGDDYRNRTRFRVQIYCHKKGDPTANCEWARCTASVIGRAEWGARTVAAIDGWALGSKSGAAVASDVATLKYDLPFGSTERFKKGVALGVSRDSTINFSQVLSFAQQAANIIATESYTNGALTNNAVKTLYGIEKHEGSWDTKQKDANVVDELATNQAILMQTGDTVFMTLETVSTVNLKAKGGFPFGKVESRGAYANGYGMALVATPVSCTAPVGYTVTPPAKRAQWSYHVKNAPAVNNRDNSPITGPTSAVSEASLKQNLDQWLISAYGVPVPGVLTTPDGVYP